LRHGGTSSAGKTGGGPRPLLGRHGSPPCGGGSIIKEIPMKKHELALDILSSHLVSRRMLVEQEIYPEIRKRRVDEIKNIESSIKILKENVEKK
jgi:RNA 3'-terminal phosphate cyclase